MKETKNSFLGRGWAFPPAFNEEMRTLEMVEDDEDIKQSLRIILDTIPGERIMSPTFGCSIRNFVFELNDPTHITMLKDAVYDALLFNEPRIKIGEIEITDDTEIHGLIHINVHYTTIITNTRSNMVFPFYIKEGTNL